jgi:hypothetical protein
MEQTMQVDELRLAWWSTPTMRAHYPGMASRNWRSLILPPLELEVVR